MDDDRFVASVGFVVSGFALAAAFLPWTAAASVQGFGSGVGAVLAGVALLAFAARRYGRDDRVLSLAAGGASGTLSIYAVWALVGPVVTGGQSPTVGVGLWLGLGLGLLGVAVAYADWTRMPSAGFLRRTKRGLIAFGVGVAGLFVGNLVAVVPLLFTSGQPTMAETGTMTVLFGFGLGLVALGFLRGTSYGFDYLDVHWPSRRDAAYMVGGVLTIFALLVGLSGLTSALGLGGAQNSLVTQAQSNPSILLVLIPLSFLVIGTGEELLFRNVIQKYLGESYSTWGAILLACVVFTLMHVPTYLDPSANVVSIFTTLALLFVLSLVLGVAYDRTDNVVVTIVIHGTFDAVQFATLYFVLTGGVTGLS